MQDSLPYTPIIPEKKDMFNSVGQNLTIKTYTTHT